MSGPGQDGGFFARYFAVLDGPDPMSALEMISEDLRFGILFTADDGPRASQFLGGAAELRAYMDGRDPQGWRHHITHAALVDGVELALGETRYPDGSLAATFVCAAQLDGGGRMDRYFAGRSPAIRFGKPPLDAA